MSTLAVVQARLGSMRLPGKVLEKAGDSLLIELLLQRLANATQIDDIIVAMPSSAINDELEVVVVAAGHRVYRGSEDDVLDRYYQAAAITHPDVVVVHADRSARRRAELCGGCPLGIGYRRRSAAALRPILINATASAQANKTVTPKPLVKS